MVDHRRGSLPPADYERPSILEGLKVTHVGETDGQTSVYDFRELPIAATLQHQLAMIFAGLCAPGSGPWRAVTTSQQPFALCLMFARWLDTLPNPPARIEEISRSVWSGWELSRPKNTSGTRQINVVARLLQRSPDLPLETRKLMRGKRHREKKPTETSYSDEELRKFRIDAHRVYRQARDRIRVNIEHLRRYRAGDFTPGSDEEVLGQILDHMSRTGAPPTTRQRRDEGYISRPHRRVLGGVSKNATWKRLFLDSTEATAILVLLVLREGFNKTTAIELGTPENINPGGKFAVHRVHPIKRRSGRNRGESARTFSDRDPGSTGRFITHVLAITQPVRDLAASHGHPIEGLAPFMTTRRAQNVDAHELAADTLTDALIASYFREVGYSISFRRVRKAVDNRVLRRPNMNSRDTHDTKYLLSDPQTAIENEPKIARGITAATAHAAQLAARVLSEDTKAGMDTATVSCLDMLNSPYAEAGQYCGASFLLCLACPNAVIMPRHLGRLHYLYVCLVQLRGTLSTEIWKHEYEPHFARLHILRTEHYTDHQWVEALEEVSDEERLNIHFLLRGLLDA